MLSHIDITDLQNCIRNIEYHNATGNAKRLNEELKTLQAFTEDYQAQIEDDVQDEHWNSLMDGQECHKDDMRFHDSRGS